LGIDEECWEVLNYSKTRNGYPKCKKSRLSRYIHCKITKENPEVVMHLCDNKLCINPKHLKGGTQEDNNKDRDNKGRQAKGERHGQAKLTEIEVKWIKYWLKKGYSNREMAGVFGIREGRVSYIKTGRSWKGVII